MGGVAVNKFVDLLKQAISATDVACLRVTGYDTPNLLHIAKTLLPIAQDQGVAVLLDSSDLAITLLADGAHLTDATKYHQTRRIIGVDNIIGVSCPLERHTAMEMGDAGADYIEFQPSLEPKDIELIVWWNEIMTVPSVIAGTFDTASAKTFISAGADFLAPAPTIWATPNPIAAIAALLS